MEIYHQLPVSLSETHLMVAKKDQEILFKKTL
jgi:hypothetical protein